MADTSQVALRALKESSIGVTPASAMQNLRFTGEGLKITHATKVSGEIRPDRQITDLIQVSGGAEGNINFQLSWGSYDDFFQAALYAASWAGVGGGTTNTITSSGVANNTITLAAAPANTITFGSAITHGIVNGQWIKLKGTAADDGFHRVTNVAGQVITVAESLTGNDVGNGVTIISVGGSMIRNGTTRTSFTLEKQFTDLTNSFMYFLGMVPGQMQLTLKSEEIVNGSFTFTGLSGGTATATKGTGAATAATTTDIFNATTHVGNLKENGVALTSTYIQELQLQLNNNLRAPKAIAQPGAINIGAGSFDLKGTLTAYFKDFTQYTEFLNGSASSLGFKLQDAAGNAYVFSLDRIKYSDGSVVAGGPNQDVVVTLPWQALMDPTHSATLQIDRFSSTM